MNLLRQYAADCVWQHPGQSPPQVRSTLQRLLMCRTRALNARWLQCETCETHCAVYNSCGDRHCPLCGGAKRSDWQDRATGLIVPGIPYYQVVFTLPDTLSGLALGNRKEMFDLLFHSAWAALKHVISNEQGFEPAALMVLHTWNQKLDAHVHVHALVPGGGPALEGKPRWVRSQKRKADGRVCAREAWRDWLVDADTLRAEYRRQFLKGLRQLHGRGELRLTGKYAPLQQAEAFEDWLSELADTNWGVNIEPPPGKDAAPEHVLKYLTRYLTGGPISNSRLVSHADGQVTFLARSGTTPGGNADEMVEVSLSGVEFVRRWCLHILPKRFTKTRRYGGYSPQHRDRYLSECRSLLPAQADPPPEPGAQAIDKSEEAVSNAPDDDLSRHCPHCGGRLKEIRHSHRPSWKDVFAWRPDPLQIRWKQRRFQYDED